MIDTQPQDFIAPWSGAPLPPADNKTPWPHFRFKRGVLQQFYTPIGEQNVGWWINVPIVADNEPDVEREHVP